MTEDEAATLSKIVKKHTEALLQEAREAGLPIAGALDCAISSHVYVMRAHCKPGYERKVKENLKQHVMREFDRAGDYLAPKQGS